MRVIETLSIIAAGGLMGAALGYFGKCSTGTCPLTANPWRGAFVGGLLASMFALAGRTAPRAASGSDADPAGGDGGGRLQLVTIESERAFQEIVLDASQPTVVDFYASWCPPCRKLHPVLERVAADYVEKVQMVKVNVDENRDLAGRYRVSSIPYLVLIMDGKVVDSLTGYADAADLKAWIDKHVKDT